MRSMIDHVVLDKRVAKETLDVIVKRGARSGISDHFLVLTKVKMNERRKVRHRSKTWKKGDKCETEGKGSSKGV